MSLLLLLLMCLLIYSAPFQCPAERADLLRGLEVLMRASDCQIC